LSSIAVSHRRRARQPRNRANLLLLAGVLCCALIGCGAISFLLWPRWPGAIEGADAPTLPITIGGVVFSVPRDAIRIPLQRRPGEQERIDLAFVWPSLTPPAPTPAAPSSPRPAEDEPIAFDRLFVSISRADGRSGPERMRTIYQHHVSPDAPAGPAGLAAFAFRDDSPYRGEDLFVHPEAFDRFAARCTRAGRGAMPGTCLWNRQIAGAAVALRFPRAWLDEWPGLIDKVERLLTGLLPARS
jgi:hypothetical protein